MLKPYNIVTNYSIVWTESQMLDKRNKMTDTRTGYVIEKTEPEELQQRV